MEAERTNARPDAVVSQALNPDREKYGAFEARFGGLQRTPLR